MKEENTITQKLKEFGLSTWSVMNKNTVFVITAIILLAGVSSYISMPREAFPEVIVPEIYIGTPYPGNSPLDIEKLVTRPIEKEIKSISGVDKITSTSIQGYSSISVKFDFTVTPEEALRKVKDKVDIAKGDPDFPKDLPADPNVFEMNFSELMPVMFVNLSGDFSLDQLKEYGEYLKDEIEEVSQISKVDITGVQDKEVKVKIDLLKMEAMNLAFHDVAGAIANENLTISGGDLLVDEYRRSVRVVGEFENMEDIENIVVKDEKFNVVYLKEIAEVEFTYEDPESFARQNEKPVVMLGVKKRAGENLLIASDEINRIIKEAKENYFPENLDIFITNDQSDQTRTQVGELENNIIFGVILVVAVLLFFLGLRNALFVGIAIPMSMFLSFMILSSMGVTLNTMVLFSLVLALGMLVDNGIVVVENIYRLMHEGMSPLDAAKYGVGEVAWPIIASTATTLGAFLPLALWPGMMGEFMGYLPLTLMIVLSSSLFVALVISPVLTVVFMKLEEDKLDRRKTHQLGFALIGIGLLLYLLGGGINVLGSLCWIAGLLVLMNFYVLSPGTKIFQERFLPYLEDVYEKTLSHALTGGRAKKYFLGTVGMLILSFILLGVFTPKVVFFPDNEPQYLNIYIEKPIGTDIEATNAITMEIERTVIETMEQFIDTSIGENFLVESVIGQVGEGTSDPMQGQDFGSSPHKARISVQFVKYQDRRGINTSDVQKLVRDNINDYPGAKITVSKNEAGPPQGAPVNIEVSGEDYELIMVEAERMKTFIDNSNIGGIEELRLDVEQGKPELSINIDRKKARRLSLSTGQIGDAMRTALFGKEVSSYKDGEDDYPIVIRSNDEYRYDADALMNQRITFRDQMTGKIRQVPISAVAEAKKTSTFSAVKRKNLDRLISIQSNVLVDEGYNPNEVVANIQEALKEYEIAEGVSYKFTGQQEEQAKEMDFLGGALITALFVIFLILVAQFNSAMQPFIIMISVVFSFIGVFLGLVIFQMDFVIIMTMIGIISLAGIVVNNAIVLIDYTNLILERRRLELGMAEHEKFPIEEIINAIVQGGKTRLRPVLLTAITTVFGLVPLAIGLNIDFIGLVNNLNPDIYIGGENVMFWGPMSWTIIFGLTFATFLTLVIVPVMYYILYRLQSKFSKNA